MAIRIEKNYFIDLGQKKVWEAINTPEILAEILPNCESLEPLSKNQYNANILIKIGPIKSKFQSNFEIFDSEKPNKYKFRVTGKGIKGSMSGTGQIKLKPNGNGTSLSFSAEGNMTGIIARVGQRLIEATGKKLMDQGINNFKQKISSAA